MKGEACSTRKIKCVVWDLDETLFDGILLEGNASSLRDGAEETVKEFDRRGILQSIASRNMQEEAMAKLEAFGLAEYFLCPQFGFGNKSDSVRIIAKTINIGIDNLAFVDDQPFERDEVNSVHPEVLCLDAVDLKAIAAMPCMHPLFITHDSAKRRLMYIDDTLRTSAEERFEGPKEEFLAWLNMRFAIHRATENDLQRAVELTERTNQLNAVGRTYSYYELDSLRQSPDHLLYVCSLVDRYGDYGRIGLALVEKGDEIWTIRLLLMSCRVMSRGVGSILLNHIVRRALDAGKRLQADFVETERNRMMYVTYRFGGMKEIGKNGNVILLEREEDALSPGFPPYVEVLTDD